MIFAFILSVAYVDKSPNQIDCAAVFRYDAGTYTELKIILFLPGSAFELIFEPTFPIHI